MCRGQETGALQQGQVQLQAQAEAQGDYSLTKLSLPLPSLLPQERLLLPQGLLQ